MSHTFSRELGISSGLDDSLSPADPTIMTSTPPQRGKLYTSSREPPKKHHVVPLELTWLAASSPAWQEEASPNTNAANAAHQSQHLQNWAPAPKLQIAAPEAAYDLL